VQPTSVMRDGLLGASKLVFLLYWVLVDVVILGTKVDIAYFYDITICMFISPFHNSWHRMDAAGNIDNCG